MRNRVFQFSGLVFIFCVGYLVLVYIGHNGIVQTTTSNASKLLVRINQTSPDQYASNQEYQKWSPSDCSAASMAEIFNAYGHNYTISDVLKVESGIGAISAEQGLLSASGIDKTASKFGFSTQTLASPTLDQILAIADNGAPVMVNFPPSVWSGGHVLVVLGSDIIKKVKYVHLADSSRLNMQEMLPARFLHYWQGFTKVLTPTGSASSLPANSGPYSVVGNPTISAAFINQVLANYNSPANGKGQALYDLGVKYGIDPAFALAFFQHESTFGTVGVARTTMSLGNLRCITTRPCYQGFARFVSWEDGFEVWYQLIRNVYVNKWHLTTIDGILQKYSPASDSNDPVAYAASVKTSVQLWRAGKVVAA